MTSPFLGFENARITFDVPDGTHTINEVGNVIANTKNKTISAVLKESKDSDKYIEEIQQFAGADGYAILLEGYLVEPQTYPPGVQFLMEGEAEIQLVLGMTEPGRFKLMPAVQSPYVHLVGIDLITPIKGIFRRN
ncbi:hypothetical protein [Iningainema tapete]|uniref:Uncharacterized protein n=1 Tax=Iningainema tapete BLCC-T55 TaxID=2748662 RepID=A0A8J6XI46_9CYAN|nr:hypothetical protein [Iningainema tapete]MBD2771141.1 hypothetical protein [Iningainema tapete BLCC-T55]